jgi:hypothetical protein
MYIKAMGNWRTPVKRGCTSFEEQTENRKNTKEMHTAGMSSQRSYMIGRKGGGKDVTSKYVAVFL